MELCTQQQQEQQETLATICGCCMPPCFISFCFFSVILVLLPCNLACVQVSSEPTSREQLRMLHAAMIQLVTLPKCYICVT